MGLTRRRPRLRHPRRRRHSDRHGSCLASCYFTKIPEEIVQALLLAGARVTAASFDMAWDDVMRFGPESAALGPLVLRAGAGETEVMALPRPPPRRTSGLAELAEWLTAYEQITDHAAEMKIALACDPEGRRQRHPGPDPPAGAVEGQAGGAGHQDNQGQSGPRGPLPAAPWPPNYATLASKPSPSSSGPSKAPQTRHRRRHAQAYRSGRSRPLKRTAIGQTVRHLNMVAHPPICFALGPSLSLWGPEREV
jgi:hypothetical protein